MKRERKFKDIRITKNNSYRVNFVYNKKHYSIQNLTEEYEDYSMLTCKEDRDFYITLHTNRPGTLIPYMKPGQTYRDTDLEQIQNIIEKYIIDKEKQEYPMLY